MDETAERETFEVANSEAPAMTPQLLHAMF